ncbi:hypothetical protein TWF481_006632 [Arthrobotrys musiformis]|uniref:Uncharacterized protein n=1 Tax=Arthrobotrys musiformis TaxID=47236 RepID=A0AAV9WAU8_9PEZI
MPDNVGKELDLPSDKIREIPNPTVHVEGIDALKVLDNTTTLEKILEDWDQDVEDELNEQREINKQLEKDLEDERNKNKTLELNLKEAIGFNVKQLAELHVQLRDANAIIKKLTDKYTQRRLDLKNSKAKTSKNASGEISGSNGTGGPSETSTPTENGGSNGAGGPSEASGSG